MVVPVIGTSQCIWCGEPVAIYKGASYTRYCHRPKQCWTLNWQTSIKCNGKSQVLRNRGFLKQIARVSIECREIEKAPNIYVAMQLYNYILDSNNALGSRVKLENLLQ